MPQNTHLDLATAEADRIPASSGNVVDSAALRASALELSQSLAWLPSTSFSNYFAEHCTAVAAQIQPLFPVFKDTPQNSEVSDDYRWLHDNLSMVQSELEATSGSLSVLHKLPHVRTRDGVIAPRVSALAQGLLRAMSFDYSEEGFSIFVEAFQQRTVLKMAELWALVPALKLVVIEEIVARAGKIAADKNSSCGVGPCVRSLRDIGQTTWEDVIEPLILFDHVLRQDPAGAYARMDYDSRNLYRNKIVKIAEYSDCSEVEVATTAIALAREHGTISDSRLKTRQSHVGYYLVAEGSDLLHKRVGFRPPFVHRIAPFLKKHPDEILLPGIEVLTFGIAAVILLLLTPAHTSPEIILAMVVVLLLPCSQSAVQLMNYLITSLLPAEILPKLDFSEGVADECLTMVGVPCLLLNEAQVHRLVDDLEVRFLGNHDPNIHFALLSDLPDAKEASQEDDPLLRLCGERIRELNEKYGALGRGSFLLLHRHRVYNPRERVWMGWERKRGKLLDLNKLLRNEYDSFPVKVGDLSIFPKVRFVITLDADTELPRGAAHRMIGAMAHPLNQAIIDPEKNIVVAGYGILQPRVGVSVQSAAKSRLASIYSGETGFDIYTRAVSDVYQDLYGEGSFTGKGIYEVTTLHRVLDRRFPRNALLSHDLIEGAYSRAGLATDIEVIEDYPSHYSAYNRRKHRWLRGDWQIAGWLFPHVPEESGQMVRNPISLISQWKIFDNLRRSLVEPATFLLFILGWLAMPGSPAYWTLATVAILFVPAWFEFLFRLIRAAGEHSSTAARDALTGLFNANISVFLTLTFVAHQTLLSLDAVIRASVRRFLTRQRMLEWETAAEAELGTDKRTPVDVYLNWTPLLALAVGALVAWIRPHALFAAAPILLLWGCSKPVALWLNRPSTPARNQGSDKDKVFLRRLALRTWRYFAEFSTPEHNWLIPDNVQEEPPALAARVSPTNLGLLLNARQVACEFGYLTIPEFAEQTLRTLSTIEKLSRYRGHLLNWYDTRTLAPLPPSFVSAVDSGNLLASLWTLHRGCLERLQRPLFEPCLTLGFLDYIRTLAEFRALSPKDADSLKRRAREGEWLRSLLSLAENPGRLDDVDSAKSGDVLWFATQAHQLLRGLKHEVTTFTPWMLPEFASLWSEARASVLSKDPVPLEDIPAFIDSLSKDLQVNRASVADDNAALNQRLQLLLFNARSNAVQLIDDLHTIADRVQELSDAMDFSFLLNQRRMLLSIGYDVDAQQLHSACYDLLATESRTAVFVAIAKEDIDQESWFRLGRTHLLDHGLAVLVSWTGTIFEYLMPALWMRNYPNTLLERSRLAAVRSQQMYGETKGVPWGISESAYFKMDEAGNYQYYAFGLPHLALRKPELKRLVISPYSTFLALNVDSLASIQNLRRMADEGWCAPYGFYEAADFTAGRKRWGQRQKPDLVRCWMAHHQGMSLLSLANFLCEGVVQRWFHADPRVQATELLLHEKPLSHTHMREAEYEDSTA
jgi:cyclic beta-1,2-glucan synthetase